MRLSLIFLLLLNLGLNSQSSDQYLDASDPEALKILEEIKSDFDNHRSHKISFNLAMEFPGEPMQSHSGTLIQAGDKFELDIDNRLVISDNQTVWLYLKDRNELQINDADFGEDGAYMSPNTIFNLYKSDEFIFALTGQFVEDGTAVSQIECKPLDPDSEYSKMRLTVEDKSNRVIRFKIFSKDGSRMTMNMKAHEKNIPLATTAFNFDVSKYPDIIVEDLRF